MYGCGEIFYFYRMYKLFLPVRIVYTILFCGLMAAPATAQLNNTFFENQRSLDAERTGSLYLSVYNFNYQRNYEYFNRFADGLTYYGFNLQPELAWYSSDHLLVTGGLFMRKDFGNSGIYNTQPVFMVNYHKKNFQIINGSLNGNVAHRLAEPIYDYDRIITNPLEYGTQFLYKDSTWNIDAWINWEKMIYKPSPEQEEISGGASVDYTLLNNERFRISIPFQFLAYHQGGQIDTIDVPLTTIVNSALGFSFRWYTGRVLEYVHTENYFLTYKDFSFTKRRTFNQGNGLMLNAGLKFKPADLSVTYWKGNGFESVHGAPGYESVSSHIHHQGYSEDTRELIIMRLVSDFKVSDHLYIGTRLEPYIDLRNPKLEFVNSLFLVYREDFKLKKIR